MERSALLKLTHKKRRVMRASYRSALNILNMYFRIYVFVSDKLLPVFANTQAFYAVFSDHVKTIILNHFKHPFKLQPPGFVDFLFVFVFIELLDIGYKWLKNYPCPHYLFNC